jgi:hypothetical protein
MNEAGAGTRFFNYRSPALPRQRCVAALFGPGPLPGIYGFQSSSGSRFQVRFQGIVRQKEWHGIQPSTTVIT